MKKCFFFSFFTNFGETRPLAIEQQFLVVALRQLLTMTYRIIDIILPCLFFDGKGKGKYLGIYLVLSKASRAVTTTSFLKRMRNQQQNHDFFNEIFSCQGMPLALHAIYNSFLIKIRKKKTFPTNCYKAFRLYRLNYLSFEILRARKTANGESLQFSLH